MNIDQLNQIMPQAGKRATRFLNPLNAAMLESGINTRLRMAAFLATVAHESGQLLYMAELASGAAYEGRKDLGNVFPGDGMRFKGRGPIQVTGRANYAACGKALGLDLISNPELLEIPENGCRASAWFWTTSNINRYADAGDFDGVCDAVNRGRKTPAIGDSNGWASRLAFYNHALVVLP
jgi:putative chitinase